MLDELHEPHEVGGRRHPLAVGLGVENREGGRAGVEVDLVTAVVHDRLSVERVEIELVRRRLERPQNKLLGNPRHQRRLVHLGAGLGQQPPCLLVVDADTGFAQERHPFRDDLLDQ